MKRNASEYVREQPAKRAKMNEYSTIRRSSESKETTHQKPSPAAAKASSDQAAAARNTTELANKALTTLLAALEVRKSIQREKDHLSILQQTADQANTDEAATIADLQRKQILLGEEQTDRMYRLAHLVEAHPSEAFEACFSPLDAAWFHLLQHLPSCHPSQSEALASLTGLQQVLSEKREAWEATLLRTASADGDAALNELEQAREDVLRAQYWIDRNKNVEVRLIDSVLNSARVFLVEAQIIQPGFEDIQSVSDGDVRSATAASECSRLSSHAQQPQSETEELHYRASHERNNARERSPASRNSSDDHHHTNWSRTPRNQPAASVNENREEPEAYIDTLRHGIRRRFYHARDELDDAQNHFDRVRDHYPGRLERFLEERADHVITGTRTELDAGYFIDRAEASSRIVRADIEYERAKAAAQGAGALSQGQMTSNFQDHASDGYPESTYSQYAEWCFHLQGDRGQIEKWLATLPGGDGGYEGVNVPAAAGGKVGEGIKAKSVDVFSSNSHDRVAYGSTKKALEEHQKMQAEWREVAEARRAAALQA